MYLDRYILITSWKVTAIQRAVSYHCLGRKLGQVYIFDIDNIKFVCLFVVAFPRLQFYQMPSIYIKILCLNDENFVVFLLENWLFSHTIHSDLNFSSLHSSQFLPPPSFSSKRWQQNKIKIYTTGQGKSHVIETEQDNSKEKYCPKCK